MSSNSESGSSRSPGKSGFVPPSASDLDAILDQYEFIEMLGRGGMGAVYKARQKSLDRLVAIKILPPGMAGEEEDGFRFEERFQREARAMAKLSHPNIIAVYDFGQASDGQFYFVMEYIEGCDLHALIRGGGLTTEHVSGWMPQICEALQYAHSKGIVHRDIKPANIMITSEGQVKIADFGLAKITGADVVETKLTMTNMAMGTPDYVAPEALEEGIEVDHRADLYAVGVMLYEMLTGKVPRGAWKAPSVQVPGLDPRYDDLIERAMDSDRTTRHQQATEISATIYEIATTPATPSGGARKMIVPDAPSGMERTGAASTAVKKDTTLRPYQARQLPTAKPGKRWGLIAGLTSALIFLGIGLKPLLTPDPEPTAIPMAPTAVKPEPAKPPVPDKIVGTPKKAPAPAPSSQAPAPAPAVPGELIFDGHRYRLISEKLTWDEARVKAEAMGGHLATITSEEENEWLMKNLSYPPGSDKHLHIGGHLPSGGSAWEWITGEPFEMSLWGGAGPDGGVSGGQSGPSSKLTLYGDKWDDIPLRFPSNYLVEWDTDVPLNSLSAAPATPAGPGAVDLLALADLAQSGLQGKWEKLPEGLRVTNVGKVVEVLSFDQTVPEEYDFEIEFTAIKGLCELNQVLTISGRSVFWKTAFIEGDPTLFHFGPLLDGEGPKSASRTEAVVSRPRLKLGQRYRSLVEVRRGSLRALIDGSEVLKYSGDMTRLTANSPGERPTQLGVGVFSTDAIFHKAELRPVKTEPVTISPAITGNPASGTTAPAAGSDPAAPSSTPSVRAGEEAGWIDLLELADVTQHSLLGQWTLEDGVLRNPDLDGKGESPHATFALTPPVTASRFDLRWRVTTEVTRGILFLVFPFPKQGKNTFVGSSLHLIELEERGMKIDWFQEVGKTREVLISVRDEVVQVFLDGELISEDKGSPAQGFQTRVWFPGDKIKGPIIGIGTLGGRIAVTGASYRVVAPTNTTELSSVDSMMTVAGATTKDGLLSNDPRIAQLDAGFKARYESDAQQPFLSAVTALNQSYTANGIGRARAAAQGKGNLSEVTALDAEKAALENGNGVPVVDAPETPESIKTLRGTYRTALAKLTTKRDAKAAPLLDIYLKALDAYTIELTKAGRIAEAREVKALRDARAGQAIKGEAPVANSAPAAEVKDDTQKATTGSGAASQLAEWVLSHGGELTIEGVGLVKTPGQLKSGRINIIELTFPSDEATASEFELLAGLKYLRRLRIDGGKPVKLDFLKNLTELQSLRLPGAVIDLEGFSIVGGLRDLPGLELIGSVTDEQIARLSGLEELRSLTLERAPAGTGFAGMKASKELRVLKLGDNGSAITDEGLSAIAATFPKLENCHLAAWDHATAVTSEGLKVLLPLKSLKTLNVTGQAVDDGAIETLAELRGLTGLMIRGTSISSEGTETLRKALSGCTVTN